MSHYVTVDDLSDWLKTTVDEAIANRHIDIAESAVAAAIDIDSFLPRSASELHHVLYDMDQDDVIETRDGPISEMVTITIDGSSVDLDNFLIRPWTVKRIDGEKILKNTDVQLAFEAGYDPQGSSSAETMPQRIKDAIIITAGEFYKSPDMQFLSERIGDYAYQRGPRSEEKRIAIPVRAELLLRGFRRPSSLA